MSDNDVILTTLLYALTDDSYRARLGSLGLLAALKPTRAALDVAEAEIVRQARAEGHSWLEIAKAAGEPKTSVHRRWRDVSDAQDAKQKPSADRGARNQSSTEEV
jgi:DNA invertase Pin-like site-specific DNA recombinase